MLELPSATFFRLMQPRELRFALYPDDRAAQLLAQLVEKATLVKVGFEDHEPQLLVHEVERKGHHRELAIDGQHPFRHEAARRKSQLSLGKLHATPLIGREHEVRPQKRGTGIVVEGQMTIFHFEMRQPLPHDIRELVKVDRANERLADVAQLASTPLCHQSLLCLLPSRHVANEDTGLLT